MKKYVTGSTDYEVKAQIREVEVERETDTSVWVNGQRRGKTAIWDIYHDTWELAHAHLMENAERHAKNARRNLEVANSNLGNIKGMKKPVV